MAELLLPVRLLASERRPMAELLIPVVFEKRELFPNEVLPVPVVLAPSDRITKDVLKFVLLISPEAWLLTLNFKGFASAVPRKWVSAFVFLLPPSNQALLILVSTAAICIHLEPV